MKYGKNVDKRPTENEEINKSSIGLIGKAKDKIVQVGDRNDDGKLDFGDVSYVAGVAKGAISKTASSIRDAASEKARQIEINALQPIFEEDLDGAEFVLTKFIRICSRDKRRMDSEVCKGSIGYYTDVKDIRFVNIYIDQIDRFGISFYPDASSELYYVDPTDRDRYIALDEYFGYLKVARISELQKIAQDLGAKHFKVTYKEEKASFSSKKTDVNAKDAFDVNVDIDKSSNDYHLAEIAAEMECPGHAPVRPQLIYLQRDSSVKNLIELRMDEYAPITHQKLSIRLSNSSGMKERDAIKIDSALKYLKVSGNTTVSSEAKNESRRILEYEIDF